MKPLDRRTFLKRTAAGAAGAALVPPVFGAPLVLTPRRTRPRTAGGTLVFEPYYVQRGVGPHLNWAYASDEKWDAFHSNIAAPTNERVVISDTEGVDRFGINTRWNVEGFGYTFLLADNAGEHYALPPEGETRRLNLNYELARSRVARNRRRYAQHAAEGWVPSREAKMYLDASEGYLEDAEKVVGDEYRRGELAQQALLYALWGSEAMELEKARWDIVRRGTRDDFFVGCDARSFYQMDPDLFMDQFTELFDYATITHYIITRTHGMPDFEPTQGDKRFDTREVLLSRLEREGVTVEGRPIFWPYLTVTPDWLRHMKYDDLKRYVEDHTRKVVGYYGDRMYAWEVVNEFHDWANEVQVTPEQAVELTKLACDVAKDTAPNVHRLINNCCPFAEYVQMGKWKDLDAKYPQRTPWEFMQDLVDADVDFTITGQQMYFPHRDFQDILLLVERFEQFGRPVQLTEVGTTSGPTAASIKNESLGFRDEPYVWHRHWDEELQADWTEALYTLAYSKPWIEACNWYDFLDGQAFIPNGGLIRSPQGERKAAWHRLATLQKEWQALGPGA